MFTETVSGEAVGVRYPHSCPTLGMEEIEACNQVMLSGNIAVGERIERFERAIAEYVGCRYAVATANGTVALHLTLLALGIGPGDEVILPTSVCPGVLYAVEYVGAQPVIADTNVGDFNLNVDHVRSLLTPRTRAIIAPHLFGIPSDLEELLALGVPVIEDCAQSIGAEYRSRRVGSFGVASVFSFYATKLLTSIDGGMMATDDLQLADRARDLRYYGGKHDYQRRYNYKMQNLHAAIGLVQLEKLPGFLACRAELVATYHAALTSCPKLQCFEIPQHKRSAHYRYIVKVDTDLCEFSEKMHQQGVIVGHPIFELLHRWIDGTVSEYTNAEDLYETTVSLPLYPKLTADDVLAVANAVLAALEVR